MSAAPDAPSPFLRRMTEDDLPRVLAIERAAYAFPWSETIFRDCLQVGYPAWLYVEGGEVGGYVILSVGAGEGHLLNLCVHPDWQGRGVGSLLLGAMIRMARVLRLRSLFLEVRESNRPAQRLYRRFGFTEVGRRKRYYPARHGREDALVMALELEEGG